MIDPEILKKREYHDIHGIQCIGADGKFHICLAHEDVCFCGMPVKRKEIYDCDYGKTYACWECTY